MSAVTLRVMPRPTASQLTPDRPEVERARLITILTTIGVAVAWVTVFAFIPGSDGRTAFPLCVLNNSILLVFTWRTRDALIPRLLLFGLAVGAVELAADAWLVDVTQTLDYSPSGSARIWRSPWWMPLAWQVVAVQFGYIGMRLYERLGAPGLLVSGALGAINIPYYEEMALRLGWWRYSGCPSLLHTPYYIILGEFLLIACFGLLARSARSRGSLSTIVAAGAAAGVTIFAAYVLAWYVVEAATR